MTGVFLKGWNSNKKKFEEFEEFEGFGEFEGS